MDLEVIVARTRNGTTDVARSPLEKEPLSRLLLSLLVILVDPNSAQDIPATNFIPVDII